MDLHGKRIILGSASPRRKELLRGLDLEFETDTGNTFTEDFRNITSLHEIPAMMSRGKSHGFHRQLSPDEILITSDTVVICGDEVMGKPRDREDAVRMLRKLSGRRHEVVTAVTIRSAGKEETFSDTAFVRFRELGKEEIDYYIDKYRPYDKAGAYAVQEWIGYIGIESIEGSFYTIMGLPVFQVYRHLEKFLSEV
ncbi:MAG TPA: septum formation protein Maf [Candidatus Cryptobacteroides intestinipullorum]|nr:septum formation protein Maf [Candidatus Cryptobacteroides intestinipullorum]